MNRPLSIATGLALLQDELKAALGVPVATSALMQVPMVQALLPAGKRVGVITISKPSLTADHLAAAGAPLDTPVIGEALNDALELFFRCGT